MYLAVRAEGRMVGRKWMMEEGGQTQVIGTRRTAVRMVEEWREEWWQKSSKSAMDGVRIRRGMTPHLDLGVRITHEHDTKSLDAECRDYNQERPRSVSYSKL
jgi:hypothetical protein